MARFLSVLLWTALFLLIVAGLDQLMVRVPADQPAHLAVATFYRDLRSRVIELARGVKVSPPPAAVPAKPPTAQQQEKGKGGPRNIEALIDQRQSVPPVVPARPAAKRPEQKTRPRYVYADDRGEIQFAETLAEIPEPYREKARPLSE